ncbi:hypothetical protein [Streptomyces angustmyceticus]|uniref:hypothetical protein n=1 Tax=Streptomyces angustmyceticus TaxID=285578 RepID=UPI0036F1A4B8
MANPKVGWGFGWLTFCYLAIAVVAVDNALASQALMPLAGLRPDEGTARLITLAVLLVQTLLAVASTRPPSRSTTCRGSAPAARRSRRSCATGSVRRWSGRCWSGSRSRSSAPGWW